MRWGQQRQSIPLGTYGSALFRRRLRLDGQEPPAQWLERMRKSISITIWQFSTTRMLHEYAERLYLPAAGIEVKAPEAAEAEARSA